MLKSQLPALQMMSHLLQLPGLSSEPWAELQKICNWAGLRFKDSKCKAMLAVGGSLVRPLITVNGKVIPAMHITPWPLHAFWAHGVPKVRER